MGVLNEKMCKGYNKIIEILIILISLEYSDNYSHNIKLPNYPRYPDMKSVLSVKNVPKKKQRLARQFLLRKKEKELSSRNKRSFDYKWHDEDLYEMENERRRFDEAIDYYIKQEKIFIREVLLYCEKKNKLSSC
jgi:hypothetical protein